MFEGAPDSAGNGPRVSDDTRAWQSKLCRWHQQKSNQRTGTVRRWADDAIAYPLLSFRSSSLISEGGESAISRETSRELDRHLFDPVDSARNPHSRQHHHQQERFSLVPPLSLRGEPRRPNSSSTDDAVLRLLEPPVRSVSTSQLSGVVPPSVSTVVNAQPAYPLASFPPSRTVVDVGVGPPSLGASTTSLSNAKMMSPWLVAGPPIPLDDATDGGRRTPALRSRTPTTQRSASSFSMALQPAEQQQQRPPSASSSSLPLDSAQHQQQQPPAVGEAALAPSSSSASFTASQSLPPPSLSNREQEEEKELFPFSAAAADASGGFFFSSSSSPPPPNLNRRSIVLDEHYRRRYEEKHRQKQMIDTTTTEPSSSRRPTAPPSQPYNSHRNDDDDDAIPPQQHSHPVSNTGRRDNQGEEGPDFAVRSSSCTDAAEKRFRALVDCYERTRGYSARRPVRRV